MQAEEGKDGHYQKPSIYIKIGGGNPNKTVERGKPEERGIIGQTAPATRMAGGQRGNKSQRGIRENGGEEEPTLTRQERG